MIQQELLQKGIGFQKGESFLPFPVDNSNPLLSGKDYFFTEQTISNVHLAWKQWRKFASVILSSKEGKSFFTQFLSKGVSDVWADFERSEIELFKNTNYFFGPHITRVDLAITGTGKLVVLDPNVMPYGIAPMVATQEILGMKNPEKYLECLGSKNTLWVCDRNHGSASSVKWLCEKAGIDFSFSDDFTQKENIIRQTRKPITGSQQTINAPGIRVFESQLWSALMNIYGLGEHFGFKIDQSLHRGNCTPCYLVKICNGKVFIAFSYQNNEMQWINFEDFFSLQWATDFKTVFLKAIFTSGCHQVTFADFKEQKIVKSINNKLGTSGYFLMQPALPCVVNGERVRIASYIGPNGEHYGSEVTRVPISSMLAHGGEHAKLSYLQV